ncbi:hypothetical protein Ddye_004917 [Dipteronia dyeriana]|uniref:RNase H type-1 domain-containing protein n=1 Tax=Dipteronia dyeriana TaxID=168575 RepID=A0AAD9XF97_9ROSI|nr:hypothetical protein Ddye_004917 [Dipteronia dyeriana]
MPSLLSRTSGSEEWWLILVVKCVKVLWNRQTMLTSVVKKARHVWYASLFGSLLSNISLLSMLDVLMLLETKVNAEDFGLICMIAWAIWENRNFLLNCGSVRDPGSVVNWVEDMLSEFKSPRNALSPSPHFSPVRSYSSWIPPPGFLKLNYGFVSRKNSLSFGVGAAIRDEKGKVLLAWSKSVCGLLSSDIGHLVALREGLLLAKSYHLPIAMVDLSSVTAAASLSNLSPSLGDSRFIVIDVKALFADVKALFVEAGICKYQAIPGLGNSLHRI